MPWCQAIWKLNPATKRNNILRPVTLVTLAGGQNKQQHMSTMTHNINQKPKQTATYTENQSKNICQPWHTI
jgi:hypothetical protein